MRRGLIVVVSMVLVAAACGDDAALTDTSGIAATSTTESSVQTATTAVVTTTAAVATTEAARPNGAAFILSGETGPYVRALQTYLDCAGYGPIAIDGLFGSGTAGYVEQAQAEEGKTATGEPDEETFAWLSRACFDARVIVFPIGATFFEVAGNAAPGDDEEFRLRVLEGQQMTIDVSGAVDVAIQGADGGVLHRPDGSTRIIVSIPSTQDYTLRVSADAPTSFSLTITIPEIPAPTTTMAEASGFYLAVDGLNVIQFGEESGEAVTALVDEFGPPSVDTGWLPKENPDSECADVYRVITWDFPATEEFVASTLDVVFHDLNYSNPAFARWNYRLTYFEDRDLSGRGFLSTAHGLSVGASYNEAVSYGFVLGGFEELSHGQLDWINVHVYNVTDYEVDGWVGSLGAGEWWCPSQL